MQQPWTAISTLLDLITVIRPAMPNRLLRNSFKRKLNTTIVVDVFEDNTTAYQQLARHGFAHVSSPPHTYGVGSLCHQPQLPQLWNGARGKRVVLDTSVVIASYTMLLTPYKTKTAVQGSHGNGQTTANVTLSCQKQLLS